MMWGAMHGQHLEQRTPVQSGCMPLRLLRHGSASPPAQLSMDSCPPSPSKPPPAAYRRAAAAHCTALAGGRDFHGGAAHRH